MKTREQIVQLAANLQLLLEMADSKEWTFSDAKDFYDMATDIQGTAAYLMAVVNAEILKNRREK